MNHWPLFAGGRICSDWVRDREKPRSSSDSRVSKRFSFFFVHIFPVYPAGFSSVTSKGILLHRDFVILKVSNFSRKPTSYSHNFKSNFTETVNSAENVMIDVLWELTLIFFWYAFCACNYMKIVVPFFCYSKIKGLHSYI